MIRDTHVSNLAATVNSLDANLSSVTGSISTINTALGNIQARNLLINGDFRISQRGTSFVAGANNDDTYNLDRWTLLSDGNDIVDITQSTLHPSGLGNSIALDVETASKKFGIVQFIETQNIYGIRGKNVTLSFYARTTGSGLKNVKAVILSWTGTADSLTSDVVSTWNSANTTPTWAANWTAENTPSSLVMTATWTRYSVTANIDTAGTNNVAVFIWSDTGGNIGEFLYIADVQLEVGSSASTFEQRSISAELALCQRYYYRVQPYPNSYLLGTGFVHYKSSSTIWLLVFIHLPSRMRALYHTLDNANVANYRLYGDEQSIGFRSITAINTINYYGSTDVAAIRITCTDGASFNTFNHLALMCPFADGWIGLSAEL